MPSIMYVVQLNLPDWLKFNSQNVGRYALPSMYIVKQGNAQTLPNMLRNIFKLARVRDTGI